MLTYLQHISTSSKPLSARYIFPYIYLPHDGLVKLKHAGDRLMLMIRYIKTNQCILLNSDKYYYNRQKMQNIKVYVNFTYVYKIIMFTYY